MMTDNLAIWHQLEHTDPEHTKAFQRPGGFRGTAIKAIYAVRKMTEAFGPCGQGWGTDAPVFTVHGDAVFCTVGLWWDAPENRRVYGIGGDIIVKRPRGGEPYHDDEAFKKAYTDALTNAMKHLGMSADVHMGLFDDSKYVQEARQEAASARGRNGASPAPQPSGEHADVARTVHQSEDTLARTARRSEAKPAATTAAGQARSKLDAQQQRAATIARELEAAGPKLAQVWLEHWPEIEGMRPRLRERLEEKRDALMYIADNPAQRPGPREVEGVTYDPLPAGDADPDDTEAAIADLQGRDEDPRQTELLG